MWDYVFLHVFSHYKWQTRRLFKFSNAYLKVFRFCQPAWPANDEPHNVPVKAPSFCRFTLKCSSVASSQKKNAAMSSACPRTSITRQLRRYDCRLPNQQDDFSPPLYKPSEPCKHAEFPISSTSYTIFQRLWFYLKISATVWNSFFPSA